jgi:hypothetical protein
MNAYRNLCTEFYDIDKPNAPEEALELFSRYAREAGGPILEPMCGSGRFLVPLRQLGFDIDGVDASPQMLQACRAKCADRGLVATLYQAPLDQAKLTRSYALVMIPAGSFCLITDPQQVRQSLGRIHELMLPNAKFVAEIERFKPQPSSSWPWGGRWVQRPDGARIIISWLGHLDAEQRVSHGINRYDLVKDGRLLETEFEELDLKLYELEEIRGLLEQAGFERVNVVQELEGSWMIECAAPAVTRRA